MKKILIVSDVHGDLNILKKIIDKNKDVDFKIYCGDLQNKDFSLLNDFDYKVVGNADYSINFPETIFFKIENLKIMLTHGHLYGSFFKKIDFKKMIEDAKKNNCSLILHGHDHIKAHIKEKEITRINPGSTTFPRVELRGTYCILTINKNMIQDVNFVYV